MTPLHHKAMTLRGVAPTAAQDQVAFAIQAASIERDDVVQFRALKLEAVLTPPSTPPESIEKGGDLGPSQATADLAQVTSCTVNRADLVPPSMSRTQALATFGGDTADSARL